MGSVSPSRRANAFAQALDERESEGTAADRSGGAAPTPPTAPTDPAAPAGAAEEKTDQAALLSLADRLVSLPRPTMAPDVKAAQRARLVAAMENTLAENGEGSRVPGQRTPHARTRRGGAHRASPLGALGTLRPRSRLAKGLAAGGLSVSVAAGAFTGAAVASTDALPGDTLYGLKLGMEDLKLELAGDDTDRGRVYLAHASTRLNEARRLLERTRSDQLDHESLGALRKALSHMRHDAAEGHRLLSQVYEREGALAPIRSLSSFSQSHRATWQQMRERLPEQLADVGDEVSSVLDAIDQEITPLRSLLTPETDDANSTGGADGDGHGGVERTARPSSPAADDGTSDGRGSSRQPSPSGSHPAEEKVLPGVGDPLEPPRSGHDTPPASDGSSSRSPSPDITIPPLFPDILPGLGIEGGNSTG
ncbi:MAG TPA: DUF5667 domain-containing protein [Streptomyces sp.]|nr:DUF5667 domain-containing protein [Streptomyces sp.]